MAVIDEVATYLAAQGLGTIGTNIFKSYLPDNNDNSLVVLDTGGVQPDRYLPTKKPTFQVFIRASNYSDGKSKLDSVRSLLHQKKNANLISNGTYFYYIMAQSEGGHLGVNDKGLDEFSINFICLTR